jgi:hypothetical protein
VFQKSPCATENCHPSEAESKVLNNSVLGLLKVLMSSDIAWKYLSVTNEFTAINTLTAIYKIKKIQFQSSFFRQDVKR